MYSLPSSPRYRPHDWPTGLDDPRAAQSEVFAAQWLRVHCGVR
jgi:hypothetical protein